ncbi:conserved hypothetical protein [delta proteobacterium NaphS2]|nr:conserved hypothetical protein [delta proteobacterium NaphS2]
MAPGKKKIQPGAVLIAGNRMGKTAVGGVFAHYQSFLA